MKIIARVCQVLLGLMFLIFGLNGFLHFLPMKLPPSDMAKQYFTVIMQSHYILPAYALQVVAGLLFLANRFVPLGLTLIAPVIVNILMFHALMDPGGLVPGLVVTILWLVIFIHYRKSFAGIFRAKPIA